MKDSIRRLIDTFTVTKIVDTVLGWGLVIVVIYFLIQFLKEAEKLLEVM